MLRIQDSGGCFLAPFILYCGAYWVEMALTIQIMSLLIDDFIKREHTVLIVNSRSILVLWPLPHQTIQIMSLLQS